MATPQQKAFCVLQFESCKSVVTVQRAFRRQFNRDPPNANNIRRWHNQFATTGCLCKGKRVWRPIVSERNVQREKSFEINTDDVVPDRWIGRHGPDDSGYLQWPPRSPDLIPCDFFFWGFVKDKVYAPPLPANLRELRDRIREAVASVTPDMLINVWEELAFRLDVCLVTNGAHIEHLWTYNVNWRCYFFF